MRATIVRATTTVGMFQSTVGSAAREKVTDSDIYGPNPLTIGTPDMFDIAAWPNGRMAGVGATGVFTSSDSLNWYPLPAVGPGGDQRSVAALPNGDLLTLGPNRLSRWHDSAWTTVAGLPAVGLNGVESLFSNVLILDKSSLWGMTDAGMIPL